MKWMSIIMNLAAILVLVGLRQYAHGYHDMETKDAYDGLVSRGLLDEAKVAEYAQAHNGWNPKARLQSIGHPDGFVQVVFLVGVGACIFNSAIILFLVRKRVTNAGKYGVSPLDHHEGK